MSTEDTQTPEGQTVERQDGPVAGSIVTYDDSEGVQHRGLVVARDDDGFLEVATLDTVTVHVTSLSKEK